MAATVWLRKSSSVRELLVAHVFFCIKICVLLSFSSYFSPFHKHVAEFFYKCLSQTNKRVEITTKRHNAVRSSAQCGGCGFD